MYSLRIPLASALLLAALALTAFGAPDSPPPQVSPDPPPPLLALVVDADGQPVVGAVGTWFSEAEIAEARLLGRMSPEWLVGGETAFRVGPSDARGMMSVSAWSAVGDKPGAFVVFHADSSALAVIATPSAALSTGTAIVRLQPVFFPRVRFAWSETAPTDPAARVLEVRYVVTPFRVFVDGALPIGTGSDLIYSPGWAVFSSSSAERLIVDPGVTTVHLPPLRVDRFWIHLTAESPMGSAAGHVYGRHLTRGTVVVDMSGTTSPKFTKGAFSTPLPPLPSPFTIVAPDRLPDRLRLLMISAPSGDDGLPGNLRCWYEAPGESRPEFGAATRLNVGGDGAGFVIPHDADSVWAVGHGMLAAGRYLADSSTDEPETLKLVRAVTLTVTTEDCVEPVGVEVVAAAPLWSFGAYNPGALVVPASQRVFGPFAPGPYRLRLHYLGQEMERTVTVGKAGSSDTTVSFRRLWAGLPDKADG
jgi:hypothetical protein